MNATIHVAGPVQLSGLYQACSRCGFVLQDYTGGMPMVVEGDDTTIPAWEEGKRIAVRENASWTLANDMPIGLGEEECRPTS